MPETSPRGSAVGPTWPFFAFLGHGLLRRPRSSVQIARGRANILSKDISAETIRLKNFRLPRGFASPAAAPRLHARCAPCNAARSAATLRGNASIEGLARLDEKAESGNEKRPISHQKGARRPPRGLAREMLGQESQAAPRQSAREA